MFHSKHRGVIPLVTALLVSGCSHAVSPLSSSSSQGTAQTTTATGGAPADTSLLPNPRLTPGAVYPVTVAEIRVAGYAHHVRDVPISEKKEVYAEYGIHYQHPGLYEVDHLIPLEIGGSNSIRNLWPQSYLTQPWNAHVKDDLENKLHDLVCTGRLPLATAQQAIAANWITAYKRYFHTQKPISGVYDWGHWQSRRSSSSRWVSSPHSVSSYQPAFKTPVAGGSTGMVWVNTRSGKYFAPGSRYYGRTRDGQYMTAAQAQQAGDVAARDY